MNWSFLTEKARFIYDGFNIQRIRFPSVKKFYLNIDNLNLKNLNIFEKKYYYSISWDQLRSILANFYSTLFIKNLNLQIIKKSIFKLKPIIGDLVDIELVNYLKTLLINNEQSLFLNGTDNLLFSNFTDTCLNYDFRSNYILKNNNLNNYNLCLLLNLNLRMENPLLNSKIRQDYLWNNLLIYAFGVKYDLTYKYYQLGNNNQIFLKFLKGQTLLNNIFSNSKYKPLILLSSNLLHRIDNIYYKNIFNFLHQSLILTLNIYVIVLREQDQ